jgi:hypothetical protein
VKGDAKVAEKSFFAINQQGVALNKTEKKLLQSRRKGNSIAARAISKGGSGYKYWADFSASNQDDIQRISKEINGILFKPPLKVPVKSIDYLPIAGKSEPSQALPLILDFINIVNGIPNDFNEKQIDEMLPDDINGDYCLQYLKEARKVAWRLNSVHPSSLGLHPIIYFYTLDGRHKPASFYAAVAWILEMEARKSFNNFIKVRPLFEDLLLKYDYLIQDINRKYRQVINSYPFIKDFYVSCIKLLNQDKNIDDVVKELIDTSFTYLKIDSKVQNEITSEDFTASRKSSVFISRSLPNALNCEICGGLIDAKSATVDHKERKQDGGKGNVENAQIAHPYCNSTYKG